MSQKKTPTIGVGSCLMGAKVRYNGDSKRKNPHIERLRGHLNLLPFCPEMAIGMGVPRETVRLVGDLGTERLVDSSTQSLDYTGPMRDYAWTVIEKNPEMAGYILVKGSPSCGFERVKRYNNKRSGQDSCKKFRFGPNLARISPYNRVNRFPVRFDVSIV